MAIEVEVNKEIIDFIKRNYELTVDDIRENGGELEIYVDGENKYFLYKDTKNEYCHLGFNLRTINNKTFLKLKEYKVDYKKGRGQDVEVDVNFFAQPLKIIERIMRHYPHTDIYEREMARNKIVKLGSELKHKEEPVKKKPNKI